MSLLLASGYDLTSGRAWASTTALMALLGVVVGLTTLLRSRRSASPRVASAIIACGLGLVGILVGGIIAANADGGAGAGEGFVGALVAVALGALAAGLGVSTILRARRHSAPTPPVPSQSSDR